MIGKQAQPNTDVFMPLQWVTNGHPGEAALGFGGGGYHRANTSEQSAMFFQVYRRFWRERTDICPVSLTHSLWAGVCSQAERRLPSKRYKELQGSHNLPVTSAC